MYIVKIEDTSITLNSTSIIDAYNLGLTKYGYIISIEQIVTPLSLIKVDYNPTENLLTAKLNGKNIVEFYILRNSMDYENLCREVVKFLELPVEVKLEL